MGRRRVVGPGIGTIIGFPAPIHAVDGDGALFCNEAPPEMINHLSDSGGAISSATAAVS